MLILEIQDNIIKARNALQRLESDFIYKLYKTFGGIGEFEQDLRNIYNNLLGLRNSFISHIEAIIRLSENKDLLTLIDSGYFERFSDALSTESLVRIASFNKFKIPETSLKVISENQKVITEMRALTEEIKTYNVLITKFRHKRNKYYITLYRVPRNNELPDVIEGSVNIEGLLPNEEILSTYTTYKKVIKPQQPIAKSTTKKEVKKITIVKK